MSLTTLYGLCAAVLVGLGLYGLIVNPQPLRKVLAFNLMGNGIFLAAAVIARRGAGLGLGGDPVPQALLITAIVVAFAASALAVALMLRLFEATGSNSLTGAAGATSATAATNAATHATAAAGRAGQAAAIERKV
jgi:multicomponent Na+:H+ antiporter subunit C